MTDHNGSHNGLGATATTTEACSGCGEVLAAGARFCPFCGSARAADAAHVDLSDVDIVEAIAASAPAAVPSPVADDATAVTPSIPFTATTPVTESSADREETGAAGKHGRMRKRSLMVAAAVAVVALIAGAFVVLTGGGPGYDLDATMTTVAERSADVWAEADRATTLDQLTAVGESGGAAAEDLTKLREELVEVGNADDRRAAEDAIDAHVGALEALAVLATLDAAKVAEWPDVAGGIEASVADLTDAEAVLVERDLPGSPELADAVTATGGRIDVALTGISDKLGAWAAEVGRIEADKAAQKKALDDYVAAFRANTERYAGLRSSLSDLVDQLLNGSGTYSNAYADLGAAASGRREVHAAMSALVPPSALVPAHTAIISAVQDSTIAVQSAITGLEEYQYDWYYTLDSTPGWQNFSRMSEQISSTYNGGVGAWDAAVAAEDARIAGITTPARPAV